MIVPLVFKICQVFVNSWDVDILQSPHVHFIIYIHNALTLKKVEKVIVHIWHPTPQIDPKSFNPLIVCTSSSKSTPSFSASEQVHEQAHCIVLSSMVSPYSGRDSIFGNGIQEAVHDSAAAIVVRCLEKGDKPTVAINGTMNYYPPSKLTQIHNYLVEHKTCIRQQQNIQWRVCFRCSTRALLHPFQQPFLCSHTDFC